MMNPQQQQAMMQQMMQDNTDVVTDKTDMHTDEWKFDRVKGVMVSTVKYTTEKVMELKPIAVKQIVNSWDQAVKNAAPYRKLYAQLNKIKFNEAEQNIVDGWKGIIENGNNAQKYIDQNKAMIEDMEAWSDEMAEKEKAEIEAKKAKQKKD